MNETLRKPSPEERKPARLIALTLGFTATQVWAALVLTSLDLSVHTLWALVIALAAVFIAILDAWKVVWTVLRATAGHSSSDCGEHPDVDTRA